MKFKHKKLQPEHIVINHRIAKILGFTELSEEYSVASSSNTLLPCPVIMIRGKNPTGTYVDVPDYYHDLNAMYELVMSLPLEKQVQFAHELYNILGHHDHVEIEAINASAKQRALAFLITMEKK